MYRRTGPSLTLLAFILQSTTAYSGSYTVKQGDSLSKIVSRELGGPVWGRQGKLETVLKLNPNIKNPSLIYPQQTIILSAEDAAPAPVDAPAAVASVDASTAEAPVSPPALAEEVAASDLATPFKNRGHAFRFAFSGILSETSIDVKSHSGDVFTVLDSDLNQGLRFEAAYEIDADSAVGLQLTALRSQFSSTSDTRFIGSSKLLKQFAVFYERAFAEAWHLRADLGSEQNVFFSQRAAAEFKLESIYVDYFQLTLGYDLYKDQDWNWMLKGQAAYDSAASGTHVDPRAGLSYGATSSLGYALGQDAALEGEVFYDRREQDSSFAREINLEVGLSLGVKLRY